MGLPEWFQPTSSVEPGSISSDQPSLHDGPESTEIDLNAPLTLDRGPHTNSSSMDIPEASSGNGESSGSSFSSSEESPSDLFEPTDLEANANDAQSAQTPTESKSMAFVATHKIWVISGFGILVFAIALWLMSGPDSPKTESRIERELSKTSEFLDLSLIHI